MLPLRSSLNALAFPLLVAPTSHPSIKSVHINHTVGHSLGAGTAILLKVLLNATQAWNADRRSAIAGKGGAAGAAATKPAPTPARLDVGRLVRVECYAFAPPPVFSAPGAAWMQDIYSFVNG